MFIRFQYLVVSAALTAFPEFRVVCQCGEGYRSEAELIIHLHYSCSCSDAKDLGIRESFAGELEYPLLYSHCQTDTSELMGNDQSGVGDVFFPAPCFYV